MKEQKNQENQNNSQKKEVYKKPELIALGDIRDVTMGGSVGSGDSGSGGGSENPFGS